MTLEGAIVAFIGAAASVLSVLAIILRAQHVKNTGGDNRVGQAVARDAAAQTSAPGNGDRTEAIRIASRTISLVETIQAEKMILERRDAEREIEIKALRLEVDRYRKGIPPEVPPNVSE